MCRCQNALRFFRRKAINKLAIEEGYILAGGILGLSEKTESSFERRNPTGIITAILEEYIWRYNHLKERDKVLME